MRPKQLSNRQPAPDRHGVSTTFDRWLQDAVMSPGKEREKKLEAWSEAPAARLAHPREDHLMPRLVAAGAAGKDPGQVIFSEKMPRLDVATSCFRFG